MQDFDLKPYLSQIKLPLPQSKKGENGRVLVIGGSKLFHAASFWSASMASRIVDMVHFSSPLMENNDLMRVKAKEKFWDGIVVPYESIDHYIYEDDCILIGPGMERGQTTKLIVNAFLSKYPHKKWLVDGGALQEVDPTLLTSSMIITPNAKEYALLQTHLPNYSITQLPCTILAKGETDTITPSGISHLEPACAGRSRIYLSGGSPNMTRGGTGDVLAGLVAGLAAKSDSFASCVVASYLNKASSEQLGLIFTPNDLITQNALTLNSLLLPHLSQPPNLPLQS